MASSNITILKAKPSIHMTKVFTAKGVESYGRARYYAAQAFNVDSLQSLSQLLVKLEEAPRCCAIRGILDESLVTDDYRDPDNAKLIERKKAIFRDEPLHWVMLDVDAYETPDLEPALQPVEAINRYISEVLPDCFQGVSFHWQLSASAGQPQNKHILKAHIWFWLKTPYDSVQLTAWAKSVSKLIDVAPLRTVQVHYTANPIYEDGLTDPVAVRSGLETGWLADEVDLVIDEVTLLRAYELYGGEDSDYEFIDPSEKAGVIGAFHRAYTVEEVINDLLPEEFEFEPGSDRRVTWLNGGGTPGGCFVTDDRMHFGSTHNSDPFDNRVVNLFDLVRHYKYGHLDDGLDRFALLEMRERPSYLAMLNWAENDPQVQAVVRSGRAHRVETYRALIAEAQDAYALQEDVCQAISNDRALLDIERVQLTKIIQDRATALLGSRPPIGTVREWIAPTVVAGGFQDVSESGLPLCTIPNVQTLLQRLNASVRYNVMTKEEELLIPGHAFSIDNKANASLAIIHSEAAAVQMPVTLIKGHLLQLADENQYNPMMMWINSRAWDGTSRLADLCKTLEVEPHLVLLRDQLIRKWLLSAVYAAASPHGVAAQGMLVLTGKQYKGKTRWFKRLVGDNEEMFREGVTLDPRDKDSVKIAVSAWITELGELDATFRKADIAALKAFITRQQDIFRKPFAAAESKFVRRTVFGGTVNDETYLRDPTGNRRFYTLPVLSVDHNHDIDMQQVWAEVYESMYLAGEQHWLTQEWLEKLNTHNEDHTEVDPIAEIVATRVDFEADKTGWRWLSATEVCTQLGVNPDRGYATKIGKLLTDKGCEKKRAHGGVRLIHTPPLRLAEFI